MLPIGPILLRLLPEVVSNGEVSILAVLPSGCKCAWEPVADDGTKERPRNEELYDTDMCGLIGDEAYEKTPWPPDGWEVAGDVAVNEDGGPRDGDPKRPTPKRTDDER